MNQSELIQFLFLSFTWGWME